MLLSFSLESVLVLRIRIMLQNSFYSGCISIRIKVKVYMSYLFLLLCTKRYFLLNINLRSIKLI